MREFVNLCNDHLKYLVVRGMKYRFNMGCIRIISRKYLSLELEFILFLNEDDKLNLKQRLLVFDAFSISIL